MQQISTQTPLWRNSTSLIFRGVLALTILGWVASFCESTYGLLDTFFGIIRHVDELPEVENRDLILETLSAWYQRTEIVMRIFEILAIGGWMVYLVGLSRFRNAQVTEDARKWTGGLYSACWIGLASVFLYIVAGFVGLFGILFRLAGWVAVMVSLAKLFEASEALSQEKSWNTLARKGASNLRVSYVLALILQLLPIIFCAVLFFAISGLVANFWSIAYSVATEGVDSLQDYVTGGVVLLQILGVAIVVTWILEAVFLFMGWNRVKNGGLELPDGPGQE